MLQISPLARLERIFRECRTIAVVGLSPKENRPSHRVAKYLMDAGFIIVPVNPGQTSILGLPCYPDLRAVPARIDLVDVFRAADQVEPIVHDAVAIGAKVIWMQQGIVNHHAARIAEEAGLTVIMDRCLQIDHMQFSGQKNTSTPA